jgi:myo-inositol catabolism protein IolC
MKSIELWKYFPTYDREVWENSSKLYERADIMNRSVLLTMLNMHARARNVDATI